MNVERLHQVLRRPIVSEKSTNAADSGQQVVFEVLTDATKNEIKTAVESLFEVSVEGVQVINVRGKIKRFGKTPGKRTNWKKAYVRLAEGDDIDFLGSGA
ncbi:MAG TPA: 50S ribosomal protein L23 [Arenicellales bacterium]|jgi:large subunit ribosomal protein L23|nr:50S ribosomal protein L23 [Acidiferrobacteraceae bacterium]MDP6267619.1 50S ribosomal protein L23 [Arenicellales bacterium]MEC7790931.1 50S ribosomal protein L23 [Pseudomonadota bacterium]MDP7451100.1 50S ribosomal protein L23 [Arenicellales bacterium]MDP7516906.1 50S ribosomal protein L23 [Arenicellales bacterium]|tara:strand:- start:3061 stop:3360 length:300 start_codon:yes stop_codon:yes gene_type:complete